MDNVSTLKKLWKNVAPSKILVFGWKLMLLGLLTRDELNKRGAIVEENNFSYVVRFRHEERWYAIPQTIWNSLCIPWFWTRWRFDPPFFEYQRRVWRYLKLSPSQLHPNGWGFLKAFEIVMGLLSRVNRSCFSPSSRCYGFARAPITISKAFRPHKMYKTHTHIYII